MPFDHPITRFHADMTRWRHHLHAHPELMFDTVQTAAFLKARLESFGVDRIETGLAQNGLVAVIEGRGPGPVTGLRADMDALPITEERPLPYISQHPGKMHACGHDGHMAMLLGAVRALAERRDFDGRVVAIFQPAEEGGGGARVMCDEGLMTRFGIERVYALHNWPGLAPGHVAIAPGPAMAATDMFDIEIRGRGGHAAMPHDTCDPVMVAVALAQGLQSIVARRSDPLDAVVLSITRIHAGQAHNVIPETARLAGTVRTLKPGQGAQIQAEMARICNGIAAAHGAAARLDYVPGYPVTVNDPAHAARAVRIARDLLGAAQVDDAARPSMGAEDFAYMLNERPGAYIFVGQGDTAGLHHPHYDFNDAILPVGAALLVTLAGAE